MAKKCWETKEWIEEQIEQPIKELESRWQESCKEAPWWNPLKWICWLTLATFWVIRIILVTVGKWAVTLTCVAVSYVGNFVAVAVASTLFAIPILGPFSKFVFEAIRQVLDRVLDFVANTFFGWAEKKIRVIFVVCHNSRVPEQAEIDAAATRFEEIYKSQANIRVRILDKVYLSKGDTPKELSKIDTPNDPIKQAQYAIRLNRVVSDLISFIFFNTAYQNLFGNFPPAFVFFTEFGAQDNGIMLNAISDNYVFVSTMEDSDKDGIPAINGSTVAHEVSHLCGLIIGEKGVGFGHVSSENNLMHEHSDPENPILNAPQAGVIRRSKYVTFL